MIRRFYLKYHPPGCCYICKTRRVCYVNIPKCASTTMTAALRASGYRPGYLGQLADDRLVLVTPSDQMLAGAGRDEGEPALARNFAAVDGRARRDGAAGAAELRPAAASHVYWPTSSSTTAAERQRRGRIRVPDGFDVFHFEESDWFIFALVREPLRRYVSGVLEYYERKRPAPLAEFLDEHRQRMLTRQPLLDEHTVPQSVYLQPFPQAQLFPVESIRSALLRAGHDGTVEEHNRSDAAALAQVGMVVAGAWTHVEEFYAADAALYREALVS